MSLDLGMGRYRIKLTEDSSNLCTIFLSWGEYHYKRLTMVVSNSPDIFQHKMNDLFQGFNLFMHTYMTFDFNKSKLDISCTEIGTYFK